MKFPHRYEPLLQLGGGGGGQVWSVRDRLTGQTLALKVLRDGASDAEALALVHEATVMSGLEGLGLPSVYAFGRLPGVASQAGEPSSDRCYMVRDLVLGESLETALDEGLPHTAWLAPLVEAGMQLAAIHRAGMLHGDIKPANIVVTPEGRGTFVDLGLAAPLLLQGAAARGLTPRFAAPELLRGEPLTVRAEVFSFGATLGEALARAGDSLDDDVRLELVRVVHRAKDENPNARYPSIAELLDAISSAAVLPAEGSLRDQSKIRIWPVLGMDVICTDFLARIHAGKGQIIALEGPSGSGRTTLARRATWTLGVRGYDVVSVPSGADTKALTAIASEMGEGRQASLLLVDDYDRLSPRVREAVLAVQKRGHTLLLVGEPSFSSALAGAEVFAMPPLEHADALELVRRAAPSLAEPLAVAVAEQSGYRPGPLRAMLASLEGRVVVTMDDLLLDHETNDASMERLLRALSTGRFAAAERILRGVIPLSPDETIKLALARVRVALAKGDNQAAMTILREIEKDASLSNEKMQHALLLARAYLRQGKYAEALERAEVVLSAPAMEGDSSRELVADALGVKGIARSLMGDHAEALLLLEGAVQAHDVNSVYSARGRGVLWGSLAIVHQRMGKNDAAHAAYEEALAQAEQANDAWNVATTRLNLAGVERQKGDLAKAILHLEAAIEMGLYAGASLCVLQARLNLANLDLYLGRLARARGLIGDIGAQSRALSQDAQVQLRGLSAEYAERSGDWAKAAELYASCATEYEALGRVHEADEAFLASVLARAHVVGTDARLLLVELEKRRSKNASESSEQEHEAIARLAEGMLRMNLGEEARAREAFDAALSFAKASSRSEWTWRALEARARLSELQGAFQHARSDREQATAILEETATKLPKDLREVFWNDPKRRALREGLLEGAVSQFRSPSSHGVVLPAGQGSRSITLTTKFLKDDRLARIFEITRDLARERDLSRLLGRVTDHAMTLVRAERGSIVLVSEDGTLEAQVVRGVSSEEGRSYSRSVAERVVRTGEAIATTSARDDERLKSAASVHQRMLQSIACVPIRGAPPDGRPIGALYLESQERAEQRFQAELPMLLAFADQAAIAIDSARLLAQNVARAEELAAANAELTVAKDRLADLLGRRTEQLAQTRVQLRQVRAEIRSHFGYAGLVGTSAAMRRMYAIIDRVKDTDVPVLITGESGTGKEVVSKAIHTAGARSKAVFLGVNCGAIPANLLESELFGHVKGAFTGADHERKGLFREASQGTLLLDEVGELPLSMQASLLRVLQERMVRPVGGNREEPIETRVIAATNRNLEAMVRAGTFREDLFYRLNVVEVPIPPLRERREDIPPLIDHFLSLFASRYRRDRKSVERSALRLLTEYDWPGNVRQLEHVLLNAWLMGEGDEIVTGDFPPSFGKGNESSEVKRIAGASRPRSSDVKSPGEFRDSEKERILAALAECQWNRVQAAKIVGLPRRTFYRRLKEYGILD